MKSLLCVAVVLCASVAAACPLVAVPQTSTVAISGVNTVAVVPQAISIAVAVPQVQVQTFALPQVAVQAQAVQSQAVALAAVPVCVQAAHGGARAQRVGILGRLLGGTRSLSISRTVSR